MPSMSRSSAPHTRPGMVNSVAGRTLVIVGPVGTRRALKRLRQHTAGVLLTGAVVFAVLVHHAPPLMAAHHHHGAHDVGAMSGVEMCLGALTAIGSAVVAVAVGILALGRWKPVLLVAPTVQRLAADVPHPVPRAGPRLLELLCVSRR